MARSWCMCAGCNRVLFQDTALWKSEKPYCEECAPKGAKRPEPPEPVEVKDNKNDEGLKDSFTRG